MTRVASNSHELPSVNKTFHRAIGRFGAHTESRAFFCGLVLGLLVWLMADVQQGNAISQAMALMFVLSAPAAFVFHALSHAARPDRAPPSRAARAWICLLGAGVLAAVQGLNLLVYTS